MPSKEPHSESRTSTPDSDASLKRVERFLRLLTWQMLFVLVLLFYLALMRPQAGRYQFYVAGEDVWMFDTASWNGIAVKLHRQAVLSGEKTDPGAQPAEGEKKE